ncbi:MAG: hypothetical protein ACOCXH_07485 [Cyclobacteriaceae bacterium]
MREQLKTFLQQIHPVADANKAYELDGTDVLTIFNLSYVNGRILNNYRKSIDFYSKLIELLQI